MTATPRILCALDFSPCSELALAHATWLAQELGAELHLVHCLVPSWAPMDGDAVWLADFDREREKAEMSVNQALEARAKKAEDLGLTVAWDLVATTHAPEAIVAHALDRGADLIVLGTHGRRGLGRMLLGSVAEEVVRKAPCPVWSVREQDPARLAKIPRRILAPVDFSDPSKKVTELAARLAKRFGAALDLLHVVEVPAYPAVGFPGGVPIVTDPDNRFVDESRISLEKLADGFASRFGIEAKVHVLRGSPWVWIADFAREQESDLVLLATHGLTGPARLLIGSTAERVVRTAPCPVLTVGKAPAAEALERLVDAQKGSQGASERQDDPPQGGELRELPHRHDHAA